MDATDAEVARLRAMESHFDRIIEAVDANPPENGDAAAHSITVAAIAAVAAYRAQGEGKWARPLVQTVDVVFDGPPGPQGPRFIEVENRIGHSISVGTWIKRPDGCWALRLRAVVL